MTNKYLDYLDSIPIKELKSALKDPNVKVEDPTRKIISDRKQQLLSSVLMDEEIIRAEKMSRSYIEFIKGCWHILEPEEDFVSGWHIESLCDLMECVSNGDIQNVIINVPPRTSKSRIANAMFVPWLWTRKPGMRVISASHGYDLSTKFSRESRMILTSDWFQVRWGARFKLIGATDNEIRNDMNGMRKITSTGGSITGTGGHILIADDLLDAKNAYSDIEREKANQWYMNVFSNRIDGDPTKGRRIVIMQRLHDMDLTGKLLDLGNYQHVCLPMEYDPNRKSRVFFRDRDTGRKKLLFEDVRTQKGQLLHPERWPHSILEAERNKGSFYWASQYQQDPVPEGGGLVKLDWFTKNTYDIAPIEMAAKCSKLIQSWDLTFKDTGGSETKGGADYVVGQVWGQRGSDIFLIDQVRDRMDFPRVIEEIKKLTAKWPRTQEKLIEDKANGPAVISTLKNKIQGLLPVSPDGDKTERLAAVSWMIEAGNVHVPNPEVYKWVDEFIQEVIRFPAAAYDDQVDGMSQALLRLQLIPMFTEFAPHGVGKAARFEKDWSVGRNTFGTATQSPWHKNWSA